MYYCNPLQYREMLVIATTFEAVAKSLCQTMTVRMYVRTYVYRQTASSVTVSLIGMTLPQVIAYSSPATIARVRIGRVLRCCLLCTSNNVDNVICYQGFFALFTYVRMLLLHFHECASDRLTHLNASQSGRLLVSLRDMGCHE